MTKTASEMTVAEIVAELKRRNERFPVGDNFLLDLANRLADEPDGERSLRRTEKPCGIVFHISPADNRCLNCGWTVLDHAHGPQWHMSEEHQAACTGCNRKEK